MTSSPSLMPVPGEPSAPIFDGDPRHLHRFFYHVNHLAARARVSDAEKIASSVLYVNQVDFDLWANVAEAHPSDWNRFKNAIIEFYPIEYDLALDHTITEARSQCLQDTEALGSFYRKFSSQSLIYRKKNIKKEEELVRQFLSAFDNCVHHDLKTIYGKRESELTVRDVYLGALFALVNFHLDDFDKPSSSSATPPDVTPSHRPHVFIPSPSFDSASAKWSTETVRPSSEQTPSPPPSPSSSRTSTHPSSPPLCHFCHEPAHMMAKCTTAANYLRQGLISKDQNGKFITPTGQRITRSIPGTTFKDQIDYWHAHNTYSTQTVSGIPSPPPSRSHSPSTPPPSSSSRKSSPPISPTPPDHAAIRSVLGNWVDQKSHQRPSITRSSSPPFPSRHRLASMSAPAVPSKLRVSFIPFPPSPM